jgi:hypothetical protein
MLSNIIIGISLVVIFILLFIKINVYIKVIVIEILVCIIFLQIFNLNPITLDISIKSKYKISEDISYNQIRVY